MPNRLRRSQNSPCRCHTPPPSSPHSDDEHHGGCIRDGGRSTARTTTTLVAFFSRKLSQAEKKYSAFDRELLAIYLTVKQDLEGRAFTIFTDHKLTFTIAKGPNFPQREHSSSLWVENGGSSFIYSQETLKASFGNLERE